MLRTMEVLVIGAGIAGLACAHRLLQHGHRVTLVDKGRSAGGRMATRRMGVSPFDTGAQFITARDEVFADALRAAGATVWCHGFPDLGRETAADGHPRFSMPGGMNRLAKHLAQGLDIRDQHTVTAFTVSACRWRVTCTPGDVVRPGNVPTGPDILLQADAVVLTAPAPQAAALVESQGFVVPEAVRAVRYAPCLCLLLDYPTAAGPLVPGVGAFRIVDDPAIGWIASQRAKGLRNAGDGIVVHATGAWSEAHYSWTDERIRAALEPSALAVLARAGVQGLLQAVELKKWKYSLPLVTVPEPIVRIAAPLPLLLAGDAYGDRPRVEGAWLSGCAAADALA
jgi:renalase